MGGDTSQGDRGGEEGAEVPSPAGTFFGICTLLENEICTNGLHYKITLGISKGSGWDKHCRSVSCYTKFICVINSSDDGSRPK